MGEIRRVTRCPSCGLMFLIVFDGKDELGDEPVRVHCPRAKAATPCDGSISTHLPEKYVIKES